MSRSDLIRVSRLTVYPVKSLQGLDVSESQVLPSGALRYDRRWAMIDPQGNVINAKRTPRVHELTTQFDLNGETVTIDIRGRGQPSTFSIANESTGLSQWLSDFFDGDVRLIEDSHVGFPDDLQAPGPTIISTETLMEVASWFGLSLDQIRRRFRANIELAAPAPFWEDRLFGVSDSPVRFQVGQVWFEGSNPCARCVVPSRNPDDGSAMPLFSVQFAKRREVTLPVWADRSRFDHFYRLAVNTRPVATGGRLAVGDTVAVC